VDNGNGSTADTGTFAAVTRVAVLLEQCLAPVPGGTGRYSREMSAALVATAPAGSAVSGWTAWHRDVAAAVIAGVDGPHRLLLPRRALVAAWQRQQGPAPRSADVVHAPTPLAPPRRGRPLVVTVHDTVPWTHPDTLTARGAAWHRLVVGHAARHADRIVVPTHAVAEDLIHHVRIAADRLVVIGEGATHALRPPHATTNPAGPAAGRVAGGDLAEDHAIPAGDTGPGGTDTAVVRGGADGGGIGDAGGEWDARAVRLGLPEDGYFLSLATLEPRKGLDVLLAALAEPTAPDLPLLVVGQPGWGGVDPMAEAARLGVPVGRVRVLGRLSDEDLAVVLSRATALAAPSRAEGFGLPVLEAMAAGVPVISSDAPALVEVGGGATLVVRRDDPVALAGALADIAGDAGLRAKLAGAGQQRAAAYTWEGAARALWEVYAELC
jgi:glycosyltransferase involved in cell wall biosynthesis